MSDFTATIPSRAGNPFIKTSSLPEGTLFIIFGAILLGLAVIVAGWRAYAMLTTYRAAHNNEAEFTAVEPRYGGPFVDPVVHSAFTGSLGDSELDEKLPSRKKKQTTEEKIEAARLQGKFFSPTVEVLTRGSNQSTPRGARPLRFSVVQSGKTASVNMSAMSDDRRGSMASHAFTDSMDANSSFGSVGPMGPYSGTTAPSSIQLNTPVFSGHTSSLSASSSSFMPPTGPFQGSGMGPYQSPVPGDSSRHSRPPSMRPSLASIPRLSMVGPPQSIQGTPSAAPQKTKKVRPPSTYLNDLIG